MIIHSIRLLLWCLAAFMGFDWANRFIGCTFYVCCFSPKRISTEWSFCSTNLLHYKIMNLLYKLNAIQSVCGRIWWLLPKANGRACIQIWRKQNSEWAEEWESWSESGGGGMKKGVEILASFHKLHSIQLSLKRMLKSQPMHRLIFVSVLHISTKAMCITLFSL